MRDSVNSTVTTLHALIGLKSGLALGGDHQQRVGQIFCPFVNEQEGYDAVKKYLKNHSHAPDAIYCFGDVQAWGAISALEEKGVSIPEETSLIGGTGFGANLPSDLKDIGSHKIAGRINIRRVEQNHRLPRILIEPHNFIPLAVKIAHRSAKDQCIKMLGLFE